MRNNKKIKPPKINVFYLAFKRLFDIIIGLIGVIIMLVLSIFVKIANVCTGDFHSIYLKQKRIGKNGKLFDFYKFRTMVPKADEVLFKLLEENHDMAREYKINKKLKNDPRITKVGKILRKTSLDEVPQFINVFLGQMSLIGNRPYLPREKEDMGKYYDAIILTKPGLTGYWQVSGAGHSTFKQRLKLEEYYSFHNSLWLDIKIFFLTFKAVIIGHGAEE